MYRCTGLMVAIAQKNAARNHRIKLFGSTRQETQNTVTRRKEVFVASDRARVTQTGGSESLEESRRLPANMLL
jgi:hypothetical protein